MRASLRRVAVVALNEGRRTGGSFDRKTTAVLLVLGLLTSVVVAEVTERGFDFDAGLYRLAADRPSDLTAAAVGAPVFAVRVVADPLAALAAGEADVAILGAYVYAADSDKGASALAALEDAVQDRNFELMALQPDEAAAFPLRVEVRYEPQARPAATALPGAGDAPEPQRRTPERTGTSSGSSEDPLPMPTRRPEGGFDLLPPERSIDTPETLAPPFPFRSLVLAYLFLVPMNFVVQVYAGSAIAERIGRKGEALLASPARPWEIVAGKAAPYFLGMVAVGAAIAAAIGAGWLALVAVATLAFAFLAMQFVSAMYARSFRELTFLTVFTSVLLTVFTFLPAVFSDVHPIAFISPITLVVMDLRGEAVTLAQVLYATLPLTLFGASLFVLGTALYREEDLFHQKPVLAKAVDSLARQVRGLWGGFALSVLLLPSVFVVELLFVTFLFAWPVPVGVVGVLLAVALTEEAFKAAPSYAAVRRGRVAAGRAVLFGALTGLGFFVAEKGVLLASLAGLMDVPAGAAVFGGAGVPAALPPLLVAAMLLGPLVLHVATAALTAWGAARDRATFLAAFVLAVLVHAAYNWTVVTVVGASP